MSKINDGGFGHMNGTSKSMQKVFASIMKLAPQDLSVLITGSTGTGKEKCAEALHLYSKRHDKPFIPFNCAGHTQDMLPSALFGHVRGAFTSAFIERDGAIASAEGGTLFLDEIGDMPLETQAALLRFTQDNQFQKLGSDKTIKANIRIICATNMNLKRQIHLGLFREDLYYRLNAARIKMPDLKNRANDLVDISHHLLEKICHKEKRLVPEITDEALEVMLAYDWPGNIRELENLLKWCVSHLEGTIIDVAHLPKKLHHSAQSAEKNKKPGILMKTPLREIEKSAILSTISKCNGNVVEAAAILDVAPSTIYRKMQQWESD